MGPALFASLVVSILLAVASGIDTMSFLHALSFALCAGTYTSMKTVNILRDFGLAVLAWGNLFHLLAAAYP